MLKRILFCLLIIYFNVSFAQSKRDSVWSISGEISYNYDNYNFYASDKYKLKNRFSSSTDFKILIANCLGKRKKFEIGLEPHVSVSQIAFNAIIPNTDFNNLADSIGIDYNNQISFYKKGIVLDEQTYTYRINYAVWGSNLNFNFKVFKKIESSFFVGFLQYNFMSKNFPEFSLNYNYYQLSGKSIKQTDILFYDTNFWRVCSGVNVVFKISKKLSVNLMSRIMVKQHYLNRPYIRFAFTSGGINDGNDYMNKCISFGIGLKYCFMTL